MCIIRMDNKQLKNKIQIIIIIASKILKQIQIINTITLKIIKSISTST
jgi:hypothetical protein